MKRDSKAWKAAWDRYWRRYTVLNMKVNALPPADRTGPAKKAAAELEALADELGIADPVA